MTDCKTIGQRILEAKNIRCQLQRIGALMSENNREIVKNAMNGFVANGVSSKFKLYLGDRSKVEVSLSNDADVQSGITLQHLR